MSRILFGVLLTLMGLLYLWLAYQSIAPRLGRDGTDWVSYLGAFLFLAIGMGAAFAGINLVRAKRR